MKQARSNRHGGRKERAAPRCPNGAGAQSKRPPTTAPRLLDLTEQQIAIVAHWHLGQASGGGATKPQAVAKTRAWMQVQLATRMSEPLCASRPAARSSALSSDAPSSELQRQEQAAADHAIFEARLRQREIELLEKQATAVVPASRHKRTPEEHAESVVRKEAMLEARADAMEAAMAEASVLDRARRIWAHLYSDALHSILRLLPLADLARCMRVNRRYLSVVSTMPSLHVTHRMGGVSAMSVVHHAMEARMRSRIGRHVGSFGEVALPSMEFLHCLPVRMPWLTELHLMPTEAWSPIVVADSIVGLHSLRHLNLNLRIAWKACEIKNTVIAAIGRLNKLDSLTLNLPPSIANVSFAPLVDLPALRTFTLRLETFDLLLSSNQMADLRSMSSVTSFMPHTPCEFERISAFFVRLLRPGHALAWTTFPGWNTRITEPLAAVMGTLSATLQSMEVYLECPNVAFFSQLPNLTSVTLQQRSPDFDLDAFIDSISQCSQLRTLGLSNFKLSCAQLDRLLSSFPLLSSVLLMQMDELSSLRCFDTPALAASLTQLSLASLPFCASSEVAHLLNLRRLQDLWISRLKTCMVSEQQEWFAVRSERFPMLAKKNCT